MAINTVSKNSIGVILVLLLVIVLSESRLFNFFTDTYLGRSVLIVLILFASYLNKILGIVSVLIIIIMFNNSNLLNFEGFETSTNTNANNATNTSTNAKDKVQNIKNAIEEKINSNSTTPTSTTSTLPSTTSPSTTSPSTTSPSTSATPLPKINVVTNGSKVSTNAIEGFDLQSTENNIKRGKQSNSIPVNSFSKQSTEVAPFEGSKFSEGFGVL